MKKIGLISRFGGAVDAAQPVELTRVMDRVLGAVSGSFNELLVHESTLKNFKAHFEQRCENDYYLHTLKLIEASYEAMCSCDVVIVIGGDGTMLNAIHMIEGPSFIGVNAGHVGFLTDIEANHAHKSVIEILLEQNVYKERSLGLLDGVVMMQGRAKKDLPTRTISRVVNEFNIVRNDSKLLELDVYVNEAFAFNMRADGLLISTPAGSTAYSLAAGGSIIGPGLDVLQIVPLMPQTLAHRPLIVAPDKFVRIIVKAGSAKVEADGVERDKLEKSDVLVVKFSGEHARLLKPADHSYYATLRNKLNWHLTAGTRI